MLLKDDTDSPLIITTTSTVSAVVIECPDLLMIEYTKYEIKINPRNP